MDKAVTEAWSARSRARGCAASLRVSVPLAPGHCAVMPGGCGVRRGHQDPDPRGRPWRRWLDSRATPAARA